MFRKLILIATFLSACGQPTTPSASSPKALKSTDLVVVMGGYKTCDIDHTLLFVPVPDIQDMARVAVALGDQLASHGGGQRPRYLFSCYSGVWKGVVEDDIEFQISTDPLFESTEKVDFEISTLRDHKLLTPIVQKINSYIEQNPEGRIFLIGHSYGGWTAMQLARHYLGSGRIAGLATIDPISPITCRADQVPLRLAGGFFGSIAGCDNAPKDIPASDRLLIAQTVPWWLNFYQTQFRILHSSAIPEITQVRRAHGDHRGYNMRVRMSAENSFFNPYHSMLTVYPEVWQRIGAYMNQY